MKNKICAFWIGIVLVVVSLLVASAFQGNSTSYTSDNKMDSFVSNSSSGSFASRLAGGINFVGQYVVDALSGRFGILGDKLSVIVNITYPYPDSQIIRGNDAAAGEDDKNVVPNSINLSAKVFDNSTLDAVQSAMCYFYDGNSLVGNSTTNSSGDCFVIYTKSGFSVGTRNVSVNYTLPSIEHYILNQTQVNFSIIRFVTSLTMGNLRTNGDYYSGDSAVLTMLINKINQSGTFAYDPGNITANATNAAGLVYANGTKWYGGGITRTGVGQYRADVLANYTFGPYIRWDVWVSDSNFSSHISSAIHSDKAICSADFGIWSAWSTCSNGIQTRSRTDSSGCIEVETQTCSIGGGGGETTCTPSWSDWSEWGACEDGKQRRTRSDGCGSSETEIKECYCETNWVCEGWNDCLNGAQNRTCNDLKECNPENKSFVQRQSCIEGLIVEYTPQELNLRVYNKTSIDFFVSLKNGGSNTLDIKWYLDSQFKSGNAGVGELKSQFNSLFEQDSEIKAQITSGSSAQEIIWKIAILPERKSCKEDWYCRWSKCNEKRYRHTIECVDRNNCGTNIDRPNSEKCACLPEFKCTEWSQCFVEYDIKDVLYGESTTNGTQHRVCVDNSLKKCEENKVDWQPCNLAIPVRATITKWCYEDYVEIYEISTNALVSRVKKAILKNVKTLDIGFIATDFKGYCSYCYDGVKNFDEDSTDCGGNNCPSCIKKQKYIDWLAYLIWLLWLLLLVLILYLAYRNREKIREYLLRKPKEAGRRGIRRIRMPGIAVWNILERMTSLTSKIKMIRLKMPALHLPSVRLEIRAGRKLKRLKLFAVLSGKAIKEPVSSEFGKLKGLLRDWKHKKYYIPSAFDKNLEENIERIQRTKQLRYEKKIRKKKEKAIKIGLKADKLKRESVKGLNILKRLRLRKLVGKHKRLTKRIRKTQERVAIHLEKSLIKSKRKAKRKEFKKIRKSVKKEARAIKRRIKRKQISGAEIPALRKKLNEWRRRGYYGTIGMQKKLDKFDGKI